MSALRHDDEVFAQVRGYFHRSLSDCGGWLSIGAECVESASCSVLAATTSGSVKASPAGSVAAVMFGEPPSVDQGVAGRHPYLAEG
jgi:hypothetical protein